MCHSSHKNAQAIPVRPHHGMCLAFFIEKGYSEGFSAHMEKMFKDTFNEMGIESKTNGCIHNPVGGCDSTPMTRAGIKSVTFAAQNPMLTWYYHTWRDMPQRFEEETVGLGFDVVLSVIDKIAKFQEKNGYNGPQKK